MLILAIILIVIGVALIMAPHYGGPPPLVLVGWVCLVLGVVFLIIWAVTVADINTGAAVMPRL